MSKKLLKLLLAASMVTAVGCKSRITGNEGNLEFSYPADDAITDFNKPIAVGAKLDLKVGEAGTHLPVTLSSAVSDDTEVLAVASFAGDTLVLEGKGSGSAELSVEAKKASGEVVKDSVNMLARVPEVLKLRHTCTGEAEAAYLVDQDIYLPFDMQMKNGQPVIGYGFHPVALEPAGALTLDANTKDQVSLHLRSGKTKAEAVVKSTIDTTQAKLILIEAADIDGATIDGPKETQVGASNLFHVLPKAGARPVCQPTVVLTAQSETTEICEVKAAGSGGDVNENPENKFGWVTVTGKKVGKCSFTVSYAAAKGGQGLATQFTTDIIEVVRP